MSVFREKKQEIQFQHRHSLDFPPHTHEDVELVYVTAGNGLAVCDGERYPLAAGDFFLAAPNRVHYYEGFSDGDYIVLVVKPSRLQSYGHRLRENPPRQALFSAAEGEAVRLLTEALDEYRLFGDGDEISGYLTALFGRLLRSLPAEPARSSEDWLPSVLDYCCRRYREPLTVESVAAALYISRSRLSHGFRRRVGLSFPQYITALRLAEAVTRLKESDIPVTEIALEVGFPSLRTFDRAFFARYGVTPRAYRRR